MALAIPLFYGSKLHGSHRARVVGLPQAHNEESNIQRQPDPDADANREQHLLPPNLFLELHRNRCSPVVRRDIAGMHTIFELLTMDRSSQPSTLGRFKRFAIHLPLHSESLQIRMYDLKLIKS